MKHFGEFKVAKIEQKEVSGQEYILEELKNLRRTVQRMDRGWVSKDRIREASERDIDICLGHGELPDMKDKMATLISHPALMNVGFKQLEPDHLHLRADVKPNFSVELIREEIEDLLDRKSSNLAHKRRIILDNEKN